MNIFEMLRKDHEIQRLLLKQLVATEGASEERDTIFNELKSELVAHAAAEEKSLYIPMIDDDMTQEKARHSIAEHHDIDELLEGLENTDMSSPGWLAQAKKLYDRVTHHLDEEEHEVFQMAGKILTEHQKVHLAKEYLEEMHHQREAA